MRNLTSEDKEKLEEYKNALENYKNQRNELREKKRRLRREKRKRRRELEEQGRQHRLDKKLGRQIRKQRHMVRNQEWEEENQKQRHGLVKGKNSEHQVLILLKQMIEKILRILHIRSQGNVTSSSGQFKKRRRHTEVLKVSFH